MGSRKRHERFVFTKEIGFVPVILCTNESFSMSQTANLHIASNIALPWPRSMVAEIAPTEAQTAFVAESRREIREILFGSDPRFLIVLGPCSIHDPEAGLEYARKLAAARGACRAAWRLRRT